MIIKWGEYEKKYDDNDYESIYWDYALYYCHWSMVEEIIKAKREARIKKS